MYDTRSTRRHSCIVDMTRLNAEQSNDFEWLTTSVKRTCLFPLNIELIFQYFALFKPNVEWVELYHIDTITTSNKLVHNSGRRVPCLKSIVSVLIP